MLACRPSGWWLFEVLGIKQEYLECMVFLGQGESFFP